MQKRDDEGGEGEVAKYYGVTRARRKLSEVRRAVSQMDKLVAQIV